MEPSELLDTDFREPLRALRGALDACAALRSIPAQRQSDWCVGRRSVPSRVDTSRMYFAYVDETGIDGKSPVLVMVGIVVNDERLGRTQEEFASIFANLGASVTGTLRELKSADLLVGKGVWRHLDNTVRCNIITNLCTWVTDRKHDLALAAIHLDTFKASPPGAPELCDAWQAAAWHIALQLQRAHQPLRKNKGKTILVFDDNKHGIANVADSIYDPPAWTDDYYERGEKQERSTSSSTPRSQ